MVSYLTAQNKLLLIAPYLFPGMRGPNLIGQDPNFRFPGKMTVKAVRRPNVRRPFWLSAPNYYILAIASSVAVFFLFWALLREGIDEAPWIPAGLAASATLAGAVVLREMILRRQKYKMLMYQQQIDRNVRQIMQPVQNQLTKLTLEKNAEIIRELHRKSEASRVLANLTEGHLEVYESCGAYLNMIDRELEMIPAGSPRLAAFRRDRENIEKLQKSHLLAWASGESRALIKESRNKATAREKIETAQKAMQVLETAMNIYPGDSLLEESAIAVRDFIFSIKVSHWAERADRAAFKGNYKKAIDHYKDALFYMAPENERSAEHQEMADRINGEIEKLKQRMEKDSGASRKDLA